MQNFGEYELIDFGNGRKLERFGPWILDRPSPAAGHAAPTLPADSWKEAAARYVRNRTSSESGKWTLHQSLPAAWNVPFAIPKVPPITLQLKTTEFGHLGLFPEQQTNWPWIAQQIRSINQLAPLKILNLFAYTGGSTLAAAAAGAHVVHVDAAKNVVQWARHNAQLSGLEHLPIRWIAEDARKFVQRELNRGNQYDAIILDPPTYGHGPRGTVWQVQRDLFPLLKDCGQLLKDRCRFFLLTCHSPGISTSDMSAMISDAIVGHCGSPPRTMRLQLTTLDQRRLDAGVAARWPY
ncbi:MAG: class I SAM-dependent methyltransferase [Pirellulaceae bacterium]